MSTELEPRRRRSTVAKRTAVPRESQGLASGLVGAVNEAWDELPSVTAPVLVIHGTEDLVNVTANAPLLAGRIPGAELCLIEGGRHGFFVEFREQASAAVIDFLQRHPLRR